MALSADHPLRRLAEWLTTGRRRLMPLVCSEPAVHDGGLFGHGEP
jgi:hypothetical protein